MADSADDIDNILTFNDEYTPPKHRGKYPDGTPRPAYVFQARVCGAHDCEAVDEEVRSRCYLFFCFGSYKKSNLCMLFVCSLRRFQCRDADSPMENASSRRHYTVCRRGDPDRPRPMVSVRPTESASFTTEPAARSK